MFHNSILKWRGNPHLHVEPYPLTTPIRPMRLTSYIVLRESEFPFLARLLRTLTIATGRFTTFAEAQWRIKQSKFNTAFYTPVGRRSVALQIAVRSLVDENFCHVRNRLGRQLDSALSVLNHHQMVEVHRCIYLQIEVERLLSKKIENFNYFSILQTAKIYFFGTWPSHISPNESSIRDHWIPFFQKEYLKTFMPMN